MEYALRPYRTQDVSQGSRIRSKIDAEIPKPVRVEFIARLRLAPDRHHTIPAGINQASRNQRAILTVGTQDERGQQLLHLMGLERPQW